MGDQTARIRRAKRTRYKIRELQELNPALARLSVYRSTNHIYAQVIKFDPATRQTRVVVTASSVEKDVKGMSAKTGNVDSAKAVGQVIAARAKAQGIGKVAFDRSGYQYHGRVKALADAARESGLDF